MQPVAFQPVTLGWLLAVLILLLSVIFLIIGLPGSQIHPAVCRRPGGYQVALIERLMFALMVLFLIGTMLYIWHATK